MDASEYELWAIVLGYADVITFMVSMGIDSLYGH
jgi:hypothetical protein